MEKTEMADMSLPSGWDCRAYEGWPTVFGDQDRESVEFVAFANGMTHLPVRFELRVEVPMADETRSLSMLFAVSTDGAAVRFTGAFVLRGDLDEVLAEVKRLHRIDWWKLKVIDQRSQQVRDAVMGAMGTWASPADLAEAEEALRIGRVAAQALPVGRRRNRLTATDLDRVAEAYTTAKDAGVPTTQAVAEALSVSRSRAAHLVVEARKLGKIPK